jgi:hypothetical protein
MELAALAAEEQDPNRLMQLVWEINDILEEKQERLDAKRKLKLDS